MAKVRKDKKKARKEHIIELIRRHEPEEDKIMRALGEEADLRGDLIRRIQRENHNPWRYWGFDFAKPNPSLFISIDRVLDDMNDELVEFKRTWINHFIQAPMSTLEEGRRGRDNAADVSHLFQPRYTWRPDGDEEGS